MKYVGNKKKNLKIKGPHVLFYLYEDILPLKTTLVGAINSMENHSKGMKISSMLSTEIPRWRSESLHMW